MIKDNQERRVKQTAKMAAILSVLMLTTMGCKERAEPPADATPATTGAKNTAASLPEAQGTAALAQEAVQNMASSKPLEQQHYEALLLQLESCPIDPKLGYIKMECEALQALTRSRTYMNRRVANMGTMWEALAHKHMAHPSEGVRLHALQLLGPKFVETPRGQKLLVEAGEQEESVPVLLSMVRLARNGIGEHAALAKFVMDQSRSEHVPVRREALIALTSSWAIKAEGTMERALEMIASDPDVELRQIGCVNLGARADDRALPLLEQMTAWPAAQPELYDSCWRGLVGMWATSVNLKRPSKAAYELTVARLKQQPRGEKNPSWQVAGQFRHAWSEAFRERATWFDEPAFGALMVELITDEQWNWLGRRSALGSYVEGTRMSSAQLEAFRKKHFNDGLITEQTPEKQAFMIRQLAEQLERVKAREAQSR